MKKMFDDDFSLTELKSMVKRLHKKESANYVLIGAIGILLLIGIVALIVIKVHGGFCCCDDDYDDFDDYDDDFEDEDEDDDEN